MTIIAVRPGVGAQVAKASVLNEKEMQRTNKQLSSGIVECAF
ncbi:hypothetical protein RTH46_17050 [Pseudomonas sp. zfem004]|nr:hypothetical protein [Pseudomonas sp. zfem004]MDU9404198.1 hypothetical protein [Pseudomonas sp. zfem004]